MHFKTIAHLGAAWLLWIAPTQQPLANEKTATFRTDERRDKSLPWFKPVNGQFPPEGSAHYISGELIKVDHTERELVIRVDRDDSQAASHLDLPLLLTLLPYGSIQYNGAPAALQDIPLGTHLHTWCYPKADGDSRPPPFALFNGRISSESEFRQCIRIQDDFSYHASRNTLWKIESVDLEKRKLSARPTGPKDKDAPPKQFDLTPATEVIRDNGFGSLEDIKPGQEMLMNLTWATLYGPGRISRMWLDPKSREMASARQMARHRAYIRERGVPGFVVNVEDKTQIVTVTFFDGIDASLFADFDRIVPEPLGWPTSGGAKDDMKPKGTLAVARMSLMMFDPLNDRKGGNILAKRKVPVTPGSSGFQIDVQCDMLLEGYRTGEVVRFFPASWKVVALPKEEEFFGRE